MTMLRPVVAPLLDPVMQQLNDLAHTEPMAFILAPCALFVLLALRRIF